MQIYITNKITTCSDTNIDRKENGAYISIFWPNKWRITINLVFISMKAPLVHEPSNLDYSFFFIGNTSFSISYYLFWVWL